MVVAALLAGVSARQLAAAPLQSSCVADEPVPTPPRDAGWERSQQVAWEEVERRGGIVPDIEEDYAHAPPAWWRYPSPVRSAELLAAEAKNPKGLYKSVPAGDLKPGDILVRAQGAGLGSCGKMTVVAGAQHDSWVTLVPGDGPDPATRDADPTFFDGKTLRKGVAAYRIRVKKDNSLGHVREIERDLRHLERTISERPPLIAKGGGAVVDEKVHDLIDESWSLAADPAFHEEQHALTGRGLALAAALDWPGAQEEAAAVLDEVLRRTPLRGDAVLARAAVFLLAGDADKALMLAEAGTAIPEIPARVHYLAARALDAQGKKSEAAAELRAYRDIQPYDGLAARLADAAARSASVPLVPAPLPTPDGTGSRLRFSATADKGAVASDAYDFSVAWPLTWRITGVQASPESGLLLDFETGRVLRDDGETERGTAVVLVQRPPANGADALARKGARNIFPDAKLKTLPPLQPGTRREQFRERAEGATHQGEVTTVAREGLVYFLILNATTASYPKLKDEYAAFVKSFAAVKLAKK
ncbi:MAG: bacterial transcriptional activator domain-containing protein [Verrucomicrobiota bacterium]